MAAAHSNCHYHAIESDALLLKRHKMTHSELRVSLIVIDFRFIIISRVRSIVDVHCYCPYLFSALLAAGAGIALCLPATHPF